MSGSYHLLLVEEDPLIAELTRFRLEMLNYRVTLAATADTALESAHDEFIDLFLVNVDADLGHGVNLIERIRVNEECDDIPVIAVSSDSDMGVVDKVFAAGANDYLVVPYDPLSLQQKVSDLITSRPPRSEADYRDTKRKTGPPASEEIQWQAD